MNLEKLMLLVRPETTLENNHLTVYVTGNKTGDSWKSKGEKADFYFIKAVFEKIINVLGLKVDAYAPI